MKKQLDPKAVWLFFIFGVMRAALILSLGFVTIVVLLADLYEGVFTIPAGLIEKFVIAALVVVVLYYIWAKLTYRFYRYEITDDGFRKEYGIVWKKYVTIPYDRIQNVDIYRGIIARILGLSDLRIQTAGASAQYSRYGAWGLSAEGRLPGLSREDTEQLRDELVRRAKNPTKQGL
jgi:uncharacterized protein